MLIFPDIHFTGCALRTGGEISVGVRKNNPKLRGAVNAWMKKYGPGTAFGNTIEKRYLQSTTYVKDAASEGERRKLRALVKLSRHTAANTTWTTC